MEAEDEIELLSKLVNVQIEYIKLLGDELNEVVWYANSHGWKSTRYDKGKELRESIESVLKQINE